MTSIAHHRSLVIVLSVFVSSLVFAQGNFRSLAQSGDKTASQEEELAARLVAAKSDEERQAMLVAEKELVSVELRKALIGQGKVLRTKGTYPQALAVFELTQRVSEQINDKAGVAEAWNELGHIRIEQGNFQAALDSYQKGLALCETLGEKDCAATSLNGIGNAHRSKGDYDLAIDYFQKGLAISEKLEDKAKVALALNNLGVAYQSQGNYTEALSHSQKGLSISEAIGDKVRMAALLNNIGRTYTLRGETDLAIEYLQKSLALHEMIGDKAGIANGYNNVGIVHSMRGDFGSAMWFFQNGLAANEALGNKNGIRNGFNNIGIVHRLQGNYSLALEYQQKGLALGESLGNKAAVAGSLNNIGLVFADQGDYPRALEHYQRGLKLSEALGNKAEIANVLNSIGANYRLLGDYDLALESFRRALQLREELEDKWGMAAALSNVGKVYSSQGNHVRALESAERAAIIAREVGLRNLLYEALTTAGNAYRALGQAVRARQSFEEAISTAEALRKQVAGGGQDQQRFFESKVSPYYKMVEMLAAQGNADEALTYAEHGKARVLLDVLRSGRVNVTKAMTIGEREEERRLRAALASLNTKVSSESRRSQPDQSRLTQLTDQREKARLHHEDFQARLYAAHPDLRVQRGEAQALSLEQAGELLADSKTALLEYLVADDTTFLFVLTADENDTPRTKPQKPVLKLYDLKVKHKDLVARVNALNGRIANNDIEFAAPAADLYNLLIGPAKAQLRGKTRLIIVPDDILWETPFQALRPTAGRYLTQTAAISYAPSLTVLREIIRSKRNRPAANTLLAMGNPRLGDQTISRSKSVLMNASLEPLPEAERMVKQLAQIYGVAASRIYVGDAAREDVLKAEAGKHRTIQLATHGVLNNASPMYSHVVLSNSEGPVGEDGLLEAWEIMNLDLKADLAVLSACETARGRIGAGEGVIGLSWAMFVAGVPTTVVSQWKVESSSTTELMLEFHRGLRSGASKSEAMRRAAMKIMANRKYDHPFYWAGFIVVGDGN
ncbi:MAG: CHAT domain-containing protein [Pyrinomonadaceae bacterium]|nr:CHAT domain-containing protein [Pyrinomonadaceae bacterium]